MFHAELTVQFLSCLEEFPRNVIRTRGRGFESLTCRNAPSLGASAAAERRCQHWRAASVGGRFARWPGSGALWLIRLTRKGIGTARRPARYLALSEQTGSDALTPDPAPAAVRPPSLATGGLPSMSHALLASPDSGIWTVAGQAASHHWLLLVALLLIAVVIAPCIWSRKSWRMQKNWCNP